MDDDLGACSEEYVSGGGVSVEGLGALCGAIFLWDQSGECAGSLVLLCRCWDAAHECASACCHGAWNAYNHVCDALCLRTVSRGWYAAQNLPPDLHLHSPLLSAPPCVLLPLRRSCFCFSRAPGFSWNGRNVCTLGFGVIAVRAGLAAIDICDGILLSARSPCRPSVDVSSDRRHRYPFV